MAVSVTRPTAKLDGPVMPGTYQVAIYNFSKYNMQYLIRVVAEVRYTIILQPCFNLKCHYSLHSMCSVKASYWFIDIYVG